MPQQPDPFGMLLVGRTFGANYRYGFNTQEQDDEVYGNGNLNTALFWEYDTRLARRWNIDPVFKEYETPFGVFNNNPIIKVDHLGDNEDWYREWGADATEESSYIWIETDENTSGSTHVVDGKTYVFVGQTENEKLAAIQTAKTDKMLGQTVNTTESNYLSDIEAIDHAIQISGIALDVFEHTFDGLDGLSKFDEAMKSGKFILIVGDEVKLYSLGYFGNQHQLDEIIGEAKITTAQGAAVVKVIRYGGIVLNSAGVAITIYNMNQEGFTAENIADLTMGVIAFIPPYGWIISSGYYAFKLIYDNGELTPAQKEERMQMLQENADHIQYLNFEKFEP